MQANGDDILLKHFLSYHLSNPCLLLSYCLQDLNWKLSPEVPATCQDMCLKIKIKAWDWKWLESQGLYFSISPSQRNLFTRLGRANLQMVVICAWQWGKRPTVQDKKEGRDTAGEMWCPHYLTTDSLSHWYETWRGQRDELGLSHILIMAMKYFLFTVLKHRNKF